MAGIDTRASGRAVKYNPQPMSYWSRNAQRVAASRGWPRAAVGFMAGALSALAMAPFFWSPILLLTLPVLVWLVDGAGNGDSVRARLIEAAKSGWWFGFGYHLAGLYWIGEAFLVEADKFAWLLPFAVTALPAGLALFFAVAAAGARAWWRQGVSRVVVLAVALTIAEWLRGHIFTGFPWNILGYALTHPLVLMQSAGLVGIYGLTFVTVLALTLPLVILADARQPLPRAFIRAFAPTTVLLAAMALFGTVRLASDPPPDVAGVKLRLVQPSVPQKEKWKPDKQGEFFRDHLALSRQSPDRIRDDLAGITHVVWAEAAMPFLPLNSPEALHAIAELLPPGTQLIAGALRLEPPVADAPANSPLARQRAFNSLIVFGDDAQPVHVYDKVHLVPFGEYLPFQQTLESIGLEQLSRMRGGFSTGHATRLPIRIAELPPFGALVCYEALFPGEVVGGGPRPDLFINITNDGWFGDTTGPHQHFQQTRVRAVEQGVPLIRVANNGITAVIDADGRVRQKLALNQRGNIDTGLPGARAQPLYGWFGDIVVLLMLMAAAIWLWHTRNISCENH